MIEIQKLKDLLCVSFCQTVALKESKAGIIISLPLSDRDGDNFQIYLNRIPGGYRLSDAASALMRLSYDNDLDSMLKSTRGKLFYQILDECCIQEDDGELFKEISANNLLEELFIFTKCLSRVSDLALWTRSRTKSTFYDDLKSTLIQNLPDDAKLQENYVVQNIPNADDYIIDYYVDLPTPLYIFGVDTSNKTRLTTIILQHLRKHSAEHFDSLIIFQDSDSIPKKDFKRLLNAANDVVTSIDETEIIKEKLIYRVS